MDQGVISKVKYFYLGILIRNHFDSDRNLTDLQKQFHDKEVVFVTALTWKHKQDNPTKMFRVANGRGVQKGRLPRASE